MDIFINLKTNIMKKQISETQKELSKDAMEFLDFLEESLGDNYDGQLEDKKLLVVIESYLSYLKQRIASEGEIAD